MFPVSLVLFELIVYITNDMMQPAMVEVVKYFHAGIEWIPTSLTAYLSGGMCLQWLFGPLSDKYGRRPIMFFGVCFFIFSCLLITFTVNIKQFILVRFLQGMGLCFIGTVGYTTIQESYDEKTCIKLIAIMANIALSAPLFGPLGGAFIIKICPWQGMFVGFSLIALLSLIGLFNFMPEPPINKKNNITSINLFKNYKFLFKDFKFLCGAFSIGFANVPLIVWIAISPVILMSKDKLTMLSYAILQMPVFIGLIFGNFTLSFLSKLKNLEDLIKFAGKPLVIGLILAVCSMFIKVHSSLFLTTSLGIYAFGLGIANPCLTRITLFTNNFRKGSVSAIMGMITILILISNIEFSKKIFLWKGVNAFNFLNMLNGFLWLFFIILFFKQNRNNLLLLNNIKKK
ncbi:MFS transporter [Enterobacterales bacterium endosymbiont of Anomoneura mori]|uniref:MFS transporter n=1 Tax=Enterobacterales bacterium endosymbiont of Anomoneura mori TaxID=3132096 RepID=UPI00399CBB41